MQDLDSIAWVIPHAAFPETPLLDLLRGHGWRVHPCLPGEAASLRRGLRVLQAELFREPGSLLREYASCELPTLIVCQHADQEASLLSLIRRRDDVVRGLNPASLVLQRLRRLQQDPDANAAPTNPATPACLSRGAWCERLLQRLHEAPVQSCSAAILVDLDHMAGLNERHGHALGDLAIAHAGQLLQQGLAQEDCLGRFGDDQFALLLSRYDADSLQQDMQSLLAQLQRLPLPTESLGRAAWWQKSAAPTEPVHISASAGLSWLRPGRSFNQVLAQADQALLAAKRQGRGRLVIHDPEPGQDDAQQTLRRQADRDPLTGLFNRAYLEARLARECELARRRQQPLGLALLDVAGLRDINTCQGYATGDRVLQELASRVQQGLRLVDWVGRYKGGCLALVMADTDEDGAARVLERLLKQLSSRPFSAPDLRPVTVALRLASVSSPAGMLDASALLALALAQLRQAGTTPLLPQHPGPEPLNAAGECPPLGGAP